MKLLEFAVQRKLDHEDQLLDYVAKNQAVPIDVLSTSLAEVIGPLEDRRASLLIENYTEMLSEYVPMTYKRDLQTGEYTVEGEIDESILDSISLVHEIDAESAISEMIEENIRLLTDTPAEVQGLNLDELEQVATRLETQTIQTMSDDVTNIENVSVEEVAQAVAEEVTEETVEEATQEAAENEIVTEETYQEEMTHNEDVHEQETSHEATQEVAPEETVEAVVGDIPDDVLDGVIEEVENEAPDETVQETSSPDSTLETVVEEATQETSDEEPEMTEEEEQLMIAEKMKRIYIRLVEDIKELGLDKSLGLAL